MLSASTTLGMGWASLIGVLAIPGTAWLLWASLTNRHTSLGHTLIWGLAAWSLWVVHLFYPSREGDGLRYMTLCLTACVVVAVFGARRPHVAPWNAVVFGLLIVLVLPLAERWFIGVASLGSLRLGFLGATLLAGLVNYLPTRLYGAAVAVGIACALEGWRLIHPESESSGLAPWSALVLLSPWLGWLGWRAGGRPANLFDSLWVRFRDRYGLVWGLRVREQFNAAARNAGWPVHLSWRGLRVEQGEITPGMIATLSGLLKRFDA